MKKYNLLFLIILILSVIIPAISYSQTDQNNEQMQAWMSYMTPGPEHKMLAKMTGDWNFDMKMWMDPNSSPTTSSGTSTFEMILGGRYQMSHHKGMFMNMPFEGENLIGFDNGKKIYTNYWIDNMGTGVMYCEGTYDDATKTINFKGKTYNPETSKDEDFRETIKVMDDNCFKLEMFTWKDGKEFKVMEGNYMKK